MTIKSLSTLINRQQEQQPELTSLLKRLRGKSFAEFWEIIGRPIKPSTNQPMPIFPYETELIDTLTRKKRLAVLKPLDLELRSV